MSSTWLCNSLFANCHDNKAELHKCRLKVNKKGTHKKFYHLKIWMTFWVCFYQKKFSHLCPLQNHDLKVKLRNFQSAIQKFLFPKMVLHYIYCKMYTLMQLVYNSIRYKALSIILLMHKAQCTSSSLQFSLVVYILQALFKLDITVHLWKSIINFTVSLQLICRHTAYSQQ